MIQAAFSKRLLAEFIGTFVLLLGVFTTIGARSRSLFDPVLLDLGRYANLGLLLFVTVSLFDNTSAHFNPAVSLAHAVAKKLAWKDFGAYAVVQCGASFLAAVTATLLVSGPTQRVLPNAARVSTGLAFAYEFGATMLLAGAYFATEHRLRSLRGSVVGAAGICAALTIGRFTTLGLNPARSLGPALLNRFGSTTWIFLLAPLLAGLNIGIAARYAPTVAATASRTPSRSLALAGIAEFAGTCLTVFLGLAGIRAVGGIIGIGIFYLGPPALLFAGALLLRSQTFFNPAITVALLMARRLKTFEACLLIAAQLAGAALGVQLLRSWLQGETRGLLPIVPVERISVIGLFILEALAAAVVIGLALRAGSSLAKPAVVAMASFAMTASLGGFGHANANPAWALGTAAGWEFTTQPHQLVWLVGGPLLSSMLLGLVYRNQSATLASKEANSAVDSTSPLA
jgi:aquaporin NIP